MTDLTDAHLIIAHSTLAEIKAGFPSGTQEFDTLDDAMWYVEELMSEDLQERFVEQ